MRTSLHLHALTVLLPVCIAAAAGAQGQNLLVAPKDVGAVSKERTAWIHWSPAQGARSYRVQRSTEATGGFADLPATPTTATEYIDRDVLPGTTYYYRVISLGRGNTQAAAAPVAVTIGRNGDRSGTVTGATQPAATGLDPVVPTGELQVLAAPVRTAPVRLEPGPPPTSVSASPERQSRVRITGRLPAEANAYSIARSIRGGAWMEIASQPKQVGIVTTATNVDGPLAPNLDVAYRVSAQYPDGRRGTSDPVHVRTYDEHSAGFNAVEVAPGVVEFRWGPVAGARRYEITGTGGTWTTTAINYRASGVPAGDHWWVLVAHFELPDGGTWTTDDATAPRASVRVSSARTSGRYRLTVNGFSVERQTVDNALQTDGNGDEVYLAAFVQPVRKNAALPEPMVIRTAAVYGDVNGYPDRIRAGTAATTGGLVSGDRFPTTPWLRTGAPATDRLPWLIWEGDLVEGENALFVSPIVWEWDGDSRRFNDLSVLRQSVVEMPMQSLLQAPLQAQMLDIPLDNSSSGFLGRTLALVVEARPADRPVGVVPLPGSGGTTDVFKPKYVILTVSGIETALAETSSVAGMPPGTVPITYQDVSSSRGGMYTLYLQVERVR